MNEKEGWDVHYLNEGMIKMLRNDCAATDEKIKTDPFARWTEEHKIFTSTLADTVTQLANAAVMYRAMQAKPVEGPAENPFGKIKEKLKDKFGKGDIDPSNSFYKQGGGSDLDDFMSLHARKHAYNPDVASTRNKTQFGENVNVGKLREDTLLNPDKVVYDSEHNIIKYIKEYDFNISTPDTPTGSHRVFINLDTKAGKTIRNTQFPYFGGNK